MQRLVEVVQADPKLQQALARVFPGDHLGQTAIWDALGSPFLLAYLEKVRAFEFRPAEFGELAELLGTELRSPQRTSRTLAPLYNVMMGGNLRAIRFTPEVSLQALNLAMVEQWFNQESPLRQRPFELRELTGLGTVIETLVKSPMQSDGGP